MNHVAAPGRLLLVDDEKIALDNLAHVLSRAGHQVTAVSRGVEALARLELERFDLVLTDLRMEGVDGLQVLATCRSRYPETEVIVITGFASAESAVEAMRLGAFYYIAKPYRLDEVRKVVSEALQKVRLKEENQALRRRIDWFEGKGEVITQDRQMLELLDLARRVAPTDCNVLIVGQTGTGKEVLAKYVHGASNRAGKPFVAINCGAFNDELLANELFGHEKGAFTGALNRKTGLIEAANGGTLFLDEVTEMSLAMQVKLLRVLQEREVLPLGATAPLKVDVRIVAATNREPAQAVKEGVFRQDLYFRLNVVSFTLPTLAERRGDIPLLSRYFLERFAALMKRDIEGLDAAALDLLMNHDYPGNVRELENIIERGVAVAAGPRILPEHLPPELRAGAAAPGFDAGGGSIRTLAEMEGDYIRWVLTQTEGNQQLAAQYLGIDRVTLWRKLKKLEGGG